MSKYEGFYRRGLLCKQPYRKCSNSFGEIVVITSDFDSIMKHKGNRRVVPNDKSTNRVPIYYDIFRNFVFVSGETRTNCR